MPDSLALQRGFSRWVASLREAARAQGIAEEVLAAAFDDVHYLPRVVERDRAQPEYGRAVWDYVDQCANDSNHARRKGEPENTSS